MSGFCRVGVHSWYADCSLLNTVRRCRRCGTAQDRERGIRQDRERAALAGAPKGASFGTVLEAAWQAQFPDLFPAEEDR